MAPIAGHFYDNPILAFRSMESIRLRFQEREIMSLGYSAIAVSYCFQYIALVLNLHSFRR